MPALVSNQPGENMAGTCAKPTEEREHGHAKLVRGGVQHGPYQKCKYGKIKCCVSQCSCPSQRHRSSRTINGLMGGTLSEACTTRRCKGEVGATCIRNECTCNGKVKVFSQYWCSFQRQGFSSKGSFHRTHTLSHLESSLQGNSIETQ